MITKEKAAAVLTSQKFYHLKCIYELKIWLGSTITNGGLRASSKMFLNRRRSFHVIKTIHQWWRFSHL